MPNGAEGLLNIFSETLFHTSAEQKTLPNKKWKENKPNGGSQLGFSFFVAYFLLGHNKIVEKHSKLWLFC